MVSALFRWPCSMSIHLPGLSLLVSALVRWPRSISIPVSQACHWWRPPFSAGISILASRRSVAGVSLSIGHEAFLFICLPGPLLLVSALFRWPCSISIHLSPRSVTAGVSPFPLATQQFYSFVFQVCHCWCPPFSAGHAAFLLICFPGLSLALPPFSAGHVAFLFICLPCDFFLFAALVFSALSAGTGSPVKGSCSFERGA